MDVVRIVQSDKFSYLSFKTRSNSCQLRHSNEDQQKEKKSREGEKKKTCNANAKRPFNTIREYFIGCKLFNFTFDHFWLDSLFCVRLRKSRKFIIGTNGIIYVFV